MENKISYICKCACAQLIGKCLIRMADLLFLATRLNWIVGLVNILPHLKWQHESDSDNMSMIFLLPFVQICGENNLEATKESNIAEVVENDIQAELRSLRSSAMPGNEEARP